MRRGDLSSLVGGAMRTGAALSMGAAILVGASRALAQEYVPQKDEAHPRIRFSDDQLSLNDRCPVRLAKLNLKMAPVYVNGKPIGFC
jgi:hypothetical protein